MDDYGGSFLNGAMSTFFLLREDEVEALCSRRSFSTTIPGTADFHDTRVGDAESSENNASASQDVSAMHGC